MKDALVLVVAASLEVESFVKGLNRFLRPQVLQTPHHRHGSRRPLECYEEEVVHMVVVARVNC